MRWEFRSIARSIQDMAPDTIFFPFFTPGILSAKDVRNVLMCYA